MQNRDGVQKGPQDHAEGQHGSKTRNKILEQLQSGNGNGNKPHIPEAEVNPLAHPKNPAHHNAAHRLFEERKQHDEAEKNSEKTRLHREIERRHLDPNNIPKI
jgi:phosphoglycerate-specific signal transduction histidine kinase